MHRRMPKKVFIAAMILAAALPSLTSGCAGKTKSQEEELVCLTDEVSEEALEEEEKRDGQEKSVNRNAKDADGTEGMNGAADTKDGAPGSLREGSETAGNCGIIYVHVCGQVACPGVYPLPAGSRLYEAIEAAGGLLESGAGEWLNQAAQVGDGQQIYVPSNEEVRQAQQGGADGLQGTEAGLYIAQQGSMGSLQPSGQFTPPDDGKVNLNTASKEQLMTLSGIGETKAASIIAFREEHGGFQKIEELMEVEGIKEGVFNKVRNQIRVN